MRTHLELKEMNKEEWEDERACNNLKEKWLRDYPDVFKEDLDINDRIQMEPVVVDLVENHQEIQTYHPKNPLDVPAYLEEAARKELQRMLTAGMLEPVQGYTPTLSRGFFVEKPTRPGEPVKACLVADFRGVNKKLRRPEHPLEGSSGILKRLNPKHNILRRWTCHQGLVKFP